MTEQEQSTGTSGKNFFSTLPGIITAVAGLITALGGFILVLNKTGCMSPKTNAVSAIEKRATEDTLDVAGAIDTAIKTNSPEHSDEGKAVQNVSWSPNEIKVVLKSAVFRMSSANIQPLPNGELVLNLKVKCVNDSKYEYHFYSYNMRVKVGEDKYAPDPLSPSEGYQSVDSYSFKNLEYNFKLPPGTKKFNLVIYDEKEEMGSATFTLM